MNFSRVVPAEVQVEVIFLGEVKMLFAQFAGDEGVATGGAQRGEGAVAAAAANCDFVRCRRAVFDRDHAWVEGFEFGSQVVSVGRV